MDEEQQTGLQALGSPRRWLGSDRQQLGCVVHGGASVKNGRFFCFDMQRPKRKPNKKPLSCIFLVSRSRSRDTSARSRDTYPQGGGVRRRMEVSLVAVGRTAA